MFEARRDDNITRLDRGAIARRDDEASIQNIEPLNVPRHRRDLLLFLKPLCIRKIKLESEWFDVLDSLSSFPKKLFHSVDISRVEMPITGGAQVHPGRHALLPELHRLPGDNVLDAELQSLCGNRQPKRPRTDNQQIYFMLRHPLSHAHPLILSTI